MMFDWLHGKKPVEATLHVMRLADMVVVHPQMDRKHICSRCQAPVGIYPSGQSVMARFRNTTIICQMCATPALGVLAPGVKIELQQSVLNPEHPRNAKRGAK